MARLRPPAGTPLLTMPVQAGPCPPLPPLLSVLLGLLSSTAVLGQCTDFQLACGGSCVGSTANCCSDAGEYPCTSTQQCCGGECCPSTANCCGDYCVGMMENCGGSPVPPPPRPPPPPPTLDDSTRSTPRVGLGGTPPRAADPSSDSNPGHFHACETVADLGSDGCCSSGQCPARCGRKSTSLMNGRPTCECSRCPADPNAPPPPPPGPCSNGQPPLAFSGCCADSCACPPGSSADTETSDGTGTKCSCGGAEGQGGDDHDDGCTHTESDDSVALATHAEDTDRYKFLGGYC